MPQKDGTTVDHWFDRPLVLSPEEIGHVVRLVSAAFGLRDAGASRLGGGRSGAFVLKIRADEGDAAIVARVTTKRRAMRERYALRRHPGARALWIADQPPEILRASVVRRRFEVWVSVVRFLAGDVPTADEVREEFGALFEGGSRGAFSSKHAVALAERVTRDCDVFGDVKNGRAAFFERVARERWERVLVHGDPKVSNVVATATGLAAIDFASGGVGASRLQRARFANAAGAIEDASAADSVAQGLDACRRLRSERHGERADVWRAMARLHVRRSIEDTDVLGRDHG